MALAEVRIRPRRPDDLPVLAAALLAQQSATRYPFRQPLPVPVEDFLHAHDAGHAWTADHHGRPVGHVCTLNAVRHVPGEELLNAVCADAHGCAPDELAWVSSFFVAMDARRLGVGRRLLDAAVSKARADGLRPCLEVLLVHPGAMSLYLATGWRVVHRFRPDWLADPSDETPDVNVLVHDLEA